MSQIATSVVKGQFQMAHNWFEGTFGDVSSEQAHWQPAGKTAPIAGHYVHVVCVEDVFLNMMLKKGAPLMASSFAGKTGIDPVPQNPRMGEWAHSVKVDLMAVRAYAKAVADATDATLGAMQDDELQKPFDLSMVGIPNGTVATMLSLMLLNIYSHSGEISTIKGLQGLKGYPG